MFSVFRTYALSSRNVLLTTLVLILNIMFMIPNVVSLNSIAVSGLCSPYTQYVVFVTTVVNDDLLGCVFSVNSDSAVNITHW